MLSGMCNVVQNASPHCSWPAGGWFSLLVAGIVGSMMLLWVWGSQQKTRYFQQSASRQLSSYLSYADSQSRTVSGRNAQQLMLRDKSTPIVRIDGTYTGLSCMAHASEQDGGGCKP